MAAEIKTQPEPAEPAGKSDEKAGQVVEMGESYTAAEEKAVLRKIDRTILPMVRI